VYTAGCQTGCTTGLTAGRVSRVSISSISRVSHNFVAVKTQLMLLQKNDTIECSSGGLFTHAVKPDASDVISEAWFYVSFPFSD